LFISQIYTAGGGIIQMENPGSGIKIDFFFRSRGVFSIPFLLALNSFPCLPEERLLS